MVEQDILKNMDEAIERLEEVRESLIAERERLWALHDKNDDEAKSVKPGNPNHLGNLRAEMVEGIETSLGILRIKRSYFQGSFAAFPASQESDEAPSYADRVIATLHRWVAEGSSTDAIGLAAKEMLERVETHGNYPYISQPCLNGYSVLDAALSIVYSAELWDEAQACKWQQLIAEKYQ